DGLLWKDGGPVIGVQIENELLNNATHLLTLKRMACEVGLDVPLYTQTGWGPAELTADELLPVFGGYPDTFWDRHVDTWARTSRNQFFFSPDRDENTIGADLQQSTIASNAERTAQLLRYPYGTCENGGGMTPAYHRRPMIRANDVGALAMVKIGNGSNLQGYYMYHGGSNPQGQCSTLQESQATGYPNDLPVISYDFQAPLREFGQVNDSYHVLRLLHLLLADFGERLAPLPSSMPTVVPGSIDDRKTLRWAARSDGQRAFIFVNNYQRLEELSEHTAVQFQLRLCDETICLPSQPVHVAVGACFCWPVNFDLDGLELTYASAQPVCRVMTGDGPLYVFAAQPEIEPEFAFTSGVLAETGGTAHRRETVGALTVLRGLQPGPGCLLTLRGTAGQRVRLLTLRQDDALRLYKAEFGGAERILLSPACLFVDGENIHLRSRRPDDHWLAIYPDSPAGLHCGDRAVADEQLGVFTRYAIPVPRRIYEQVATRVQVAVTAKPVRIGPAGVATTPEEADWDGAETWQVKIPAEALEDASEAYLVVDYVGDAARAYLDEQLVADDFYYGRTWEIGLHRFAPKVLEQGLTLRFLPLRRDAPVYIEEEFRPDFGEDESFIHIRDVRIEVESERCLRYPGPPA
ncbi:MAG: beta-galactosidase, partial [bacterium]